MSRTYKNILGNTNPEATCTLRSPRKTRDRLWYQSLVAIVAVTVLIFE